MLILLLIILVLGALGAIIYHNTFGFGAKKKYENCMKACEKAIINESNLPACKIRCEEITGYSPIREKSGKKATSAPSAISNNDDYYLCEWSWPQRVLNKQTGEIAVSCPRTHPWCHSKDLTKDGAGCCEFVNEQTMEYTNCLTIAELK